MPERTSNSKLVHGIDLDRLLALVEVKVPGFGVTEMTYLSLIPVSFFASHGYQVICRVGGDAGLFRVLLPNDYRVVND